MRGQAKDRRAESKRVEAVKSKLRRIGNRKWHNDRRMPWPENYSPRKIKI